MTTTTTPSKKVRSKPTRKVITLSQLTAKKNNPPVTTPAATPKKKRAKPTRSKATGASPVKKREARIEEKVLKNGTTVRTWMKNYHYGKAGTIIDHTEGVYWGVSMLDPEDHPTVAKVREILEQDGNDIANALDFLEGFDDGANAWETMLSESE